MNLRETRFQNKKVAEASSSVTRVSIHLATSHFTRQVIPLSTELCTQPAIFYSSWNTKWKLEVYRDKNKGTLSCFMAVQFHFLICYLTTLSILAIYRVANEMIQYLIY
jgi:hypothetical protein